MEQADATAKAEADATAPKPQITLKIKNDIVGLYSDIINENMDELPTNLKRLEWIYHWGHEHGILTIAATRNPGYADSVREQVKALGENLKKMYDEKKKEVTDGLKDLSSNMAFISKAFDDVFSQMITLITSLDCEEIIKFDESLNVFDELGDKANVVQLFRREDIKSKAEVVNAITFYSYNLAAVEMFRRGIDMAINDVDQEKVTEEYGNQVANISESFALLFKEINSIMNE